MNAETLLEGTPDSERRLREVYALTEAAIADRTLDELLPELLVHVQMFFEVDAVAIFLLDSGGEQLILRALRGVREATGEVVRVPRDRGIAGRIFSSGAPEVIDEVEAADLAIPVLARAGIRSAMGVPLLVERREIGVVVVGTFEPRRLTPDDVRFLEVLCERIAYAVERARTHDTLREYAAQQTALVGLAQRAMVAADVQHAFDDAMTTVARTLHVELVDLLERRDDALVFRAGTGWRDGLRDQVVASAASRAPCARTLRTGEPTVVERLAEAKDFEPPPLLVEAGVTSVASVVVRDVEGAFGTLGAYSRVPRELTADDVRFLSAIAGILSLTLQRFRIAGRLDEERSRLALILELLPVGVYAVDAEGRVVHTNAVARTIWRQAAVGGSVHAAEFSAWHPDGTPLLVEERPIVRTLRDGTTTAGLELVVERADGERRNILATTIPLHDGSRRIGAISVTIDVTESRRIEREQRLLAQASVALSSTTDLRATIERFAHTILPQLGDWCVVFVVRRNEVEPMAVARARSDETLAHALEERQPVERMRGLGLRAAVLRGESIVHPKIDAPEEVARDLGVDHPEVVRTLGARSYMIVPMKASENPIGAIALVRSHTGRRYTRHDLALAEDLARRAAFSVENALLHAEREEDARARAEFLAVASHDLRNPLAAISSMAALIARAKDGESLSKVRALAARIERNARRMDTLIRDLLDLESLRQGGLELDLAEHEVASIVNDAVDMLRPVAEQRRQILEAIDEVGETLVRCDRERILEVLSNLIGNAIKFAPERGRIAVSVAPIDGGVRFTVCDDGPGIDPAHLPNVFDRFWRAERGKGGVGLGLAIAKGIVDAHGGVIRAENAETGGACLSFDLPTKSTGTGRFSLTGKP